jgi:hypothetical protein
MLAHHQTTILQVKNLEHLRRDRTTGHMCLLSRTRSHFPKAPVSNSSSYLPPSSAVKTQLCCFPSLFSCPCLRAQCCCLFTTGSLQQGHELKSDRIIASTAPAAGAAMAGSITSLACSCGHHDLVPVFCRMGLHGLHCTT